MTEQLAAMRQALEALSDFDYDKRQAAITSLHTAIEAETAQGQEPVVVPSFIRQRLEREIEAAINPKGMSVHDGRTRALAADIAYLLKAIDLYTTPPAAPVQVSPQPSKPLTDDLYQAIESMIESHEAGDLDGWEVQLVKRRLREAAHGIKEKK